MAQDKELEIRLQFLEEAQDYVNTIASGMLGLATAQVDNQRMDVVLRAAHSIKGGAAMMGFQTLSHLAHRLEDFFKVLKTQKPSIDASLERLLLAGVDCLDQAIAVNHQERDVDEQWLETYANPVFEQLYQRLGEPTPVDTATLLLPEEGQDMVALLFESEVEERLQLLESILADPKKPCLFEEISNMAQDLSDLGEMLQLNAFRSLCESITKNLEATPERVEEIAGLALQEWRRSQAAVLVGQVDTLPDQIDLDQGAEVLMQDLMQAGDPLDLMRAGCPLHESLPISEQKSDIQTSDFKTVHLSVSSELIPESAPSTNNKDDRENTVRVPIKLIEQLNELFGELTIERNGLNLYIERLRNLVKNLSHRIRSLRRTEPNEGILHVLPSDVMEDIVRIQEVTDDIDLSLEDTDQSVRELNRTAKQLQTSLNQVRMRPFADLVGRFPRFLRELSLQYGKNVDLKIHGDGTLIDRTILEALSDPLMHLLRNAFDHGIEDPATRQVGAKPEQGAIEITADHRGNQTIITVSDDGGGINLDKIRQQAKNLGLDAEAIAQASDQELLTLIFEPGFSTAVQVTDLSGRGVGLDVVRTNLRQIRGDIKVETQLGLGTTFTLSVPLTLSVALVLLVESNGMLLAFPNDAIKQIILLNPEQIFTIAGNEVLSWEGNMVPLIRLGDWLEFRCPRKKADNDAMPSMSAPSVLMIDQGNEWVGIQVDRCWGEQEVAIRKVEGALAMPPGFSSCTILGDGRVVPLVNAPELLHWIASCKRSYSSEQKDKPPTTTLPKNQKDTILVVDDSINVRRFLSLTLEKAGYRVEQAKDGQDGLEKILSGLQIRAVICDIDMPRLNGYGLLARVKSNPAFKQLPIVMLTSRSAQKERGLAMNLGATAYFSKPYNEQELLQTLKQLLL